VKFFSRETLVVKPIVSHTRRSKENWLVQS